MSLQSHALKEVPVAPGRFFGAASKSGQGRGCFFFFAALLFTFASSLQAEIVWIGDLSSTDFPEISGSLYVGSPTDGSLEINASSGGNGIAEAHISNGLYIGGVSSTGIVDVVGGGSPGSALLGSRFTVLSNGVLTVRDGGVHNTESLYFLYDGTANVLDGGALVATGGVYLDSSVAEEAPTLNIGSGSTVHAGSVSVGGTSEALLNLHGDALLEAGFTQVSSGGVANINGKIIGDVQVSGPGALLRGAGEIDGNLVLHGTTFGPDELGGLPEISGQLELRGDTLLKLDVTDSLYSPLSVGGGIYFYEQTRIELIFDYNPLGEVFDLNDFFDTPSIHFGFNYEFSMDSLIVSGIGDDAYFSILDFSGNELRFGDFPGNGAPAPVSEPPALALLVIGLLLVVISYGGSNRNSRDRWRRTVPGRALACTP